MALIDRRPVFVKVGADTTQSRGTDHRVPIRNHVMTFLARSRVHLRGLSADQGRRGWHQKHRQNKPYGKGQRLPM